MVQHERRVSDIERSVVVSEPVAAGVVEAQARALAHALVCHVEDLVALVDRFHLHPKASLVRPCEQRIRDVAGPGAHVEQPQRALSPVDASDAGVGVPARGQRDERPPAERHATEPPVRACEVAQVVDQDVVVERSVEELRSVAHASHRASVARRRRSARCAGR
jgi:hypothetical protein